MGEFLLLVVFASVLWGFYSDWRVWKQDQARLEEKVALRQRYLSLAGDAPSAWEGFGDALRQAGYPRDAREAYLQAHRLRLEAGEGKPAPSEGSDPADPEPPPALAPPTESVPVVGPAVGPEAGDDSPLRAMDPGGKAQLTSDSVLDLVAPEAAEEARNPWGTRALAPLPEARGGDLEEWDLGKLPVPATGAPSRVVSDPTGGSGLENKLKLVQLELEETEDPGRFGQTLHTRQQICRLCGHLSLPQARDCEICGAALPVATLLDTWRHPQYRAEFKTTAFWIFVQFTIVGVAIMTTAFLPGLARLSVAVAALIVIPLRLLHKIGDR